MFDENLLLKSFGANLQKLRVSRHITQEQLAALADFDRTYISLLERGKRNPSLTSIYRLAIALEIPAATLFINE